MMQAIADLLAEDVNVAKLRISSFMEEAGDR